jgi:hypothetical protein
VKRIIVDVKRRDGSVAFKSRLAPNAGLPFDYFGSFKAAAAPKGIQVIAYFEVLVEGDTRTGKGPAYDHPEWETIVEVENQGLMPQSQYSQKGPTLMPSPCRSDVQKYESAVFRDLLNDLKPDAVLLDELRFFAKAADYSDTARVHFESWISMAPAPWPASVTDKNSARYPLWMTYRVGVIHEFLNRLKRVRDDASPATRLCFSAPGYFEPAVDLGINWCVSAYKPRLWYADRRFQRFSATDLVDELILLCNETNPILVKEIVQSALRGTRHSRPVSIILRASQFVGRPARFRECLQMIREGGVSPVIRDPDALDRDDFWEILKEESP